MWVDISSIIKDIGVGQYIDITLLPTNTNTGDFGVLDDSNATVLDDVFCTMVENVDDVVDSQSGSYISRVTYDFYIPYRFSLGYQLEGATITTKDNRKFTITHRPINRKYVSHCVVTATEDKLDYIGGL
ncbi:MAG: hypothetical protein ACRCX2_28370 [Paraclostridium sp.]